MAAAAAVNGYHHHHHQHRDTLQQEISHPMTDAAAAAAPSTGGEPTLGDQLYFRCFGSGYVGTADSANFRLPIGHQQRQSHHKDEATSAESTTTDTATTIATTISSTMRPSSVRPQPLLNDRTTSPPHSDATITTASVMGDHRDHRSLNGAAATADDVTGVATPAADDDDDNDDDGHDNLGHISDYKGVRRRQHLAAYMHNHRRNHHHHHHHHHPRQQEHCANRPRPDASPAPEPPSESCVTVHRCCFSSRLSDSCTDASDAVRPAAVQPWRTPFGAVCATIVLCIVLGTMVGPSAAAKQDGCTFPARWEGSWFLSGNQQPVFIKGSTLSFRGKCIASEGDKFLVVDEKGCHRCLVMYEKHRNVLQYKESECDGDNMYMDQSNPAAMPMREQPQRSILNSDHRGAAHPNANGNGNHGHARVSSSDPYSMRSHDDATNDYYCKGRETLQTLCEQIAGDALLYSLFKEDAEPVKCPLRGPYTFTYNRGHGECMNPVSNIESCTEDSRLLLSFQACPDVSGTESTVEELTCLATWKDGNSRYLVGLVSHHHAISNEERYRCFVYEKITPGNGGSSKDEYKLAQSGDATCNGLDSAEVGSRIMTLQMAPTAERCDFPTWFKGPKHWHALMGNTGYIFHQSDGSLHITKPNGMMETRALCEQINKQTPTEMMSVVHYTTGCQSGFMCMMFYRRDLHVAEIQMGTPASRLEDACAPDHFDVNKLPFITLLANNPELQMCPLQGLYALRGAVGSPFMSSRHKRNHNTKSHSHHHHAAGHRRHSTLSFRNPDEFDHTSWRTHSRGLPKRKRRDTATPHVHADPRASTAPAAAVENTHRGSSSTTTSTTTTTTTIYDPIIGDPDDDAPDADADGLAPPPQPPRRLAAERRNATRNRRDTPGCIVNYAAQRQLLIGCQEPNVIEVRPQCSEEGDEVYNCHGSWVENDTTFIIARHAGSQHGVCISFLPLEGNAARLIVGDACRRSNQPPADHHLAANLTVFGSCSDPSSSTRPTALSWLWMAGVALIAVTAR